MSTLPYHIPALLEEAVDGLNISPSGIYIDATFGGGGHSKAILDRLGPEGRLFGFDRDIDAYQNKIEDPRFTFVHSDFRYIPNFMRYYGIERVDGVLADLGVSFHHFDSGERGFSFRADSHLDMRMNRSGVLTAAKVLETYSEHRLESLFRNYGDIKRPTPIVKAIIEARKSGKGIVTTGHLTELLQPFLNPRQEKKDLARIFQALRIEVNSEVEALRKLLESLPKVLRTGGRISIITYHSLEDRMVKNFFRCGNTEGKAEKDFFGNFETPWTLITRNPIVADEREIEANPRSRSAKLRVAELKQSIPQKNE